MFTARSRRGPRTLTSPRYGRPEMCGAGEGSVRGEAADLPPAASHPLAPEAQPDVRFSDVVAELQRLSDLAAEIGGPNAYRAELLCRRVESLLRLLRAQFVGEIAVPGRLGALR